MTRNMRFWIRSLASLSGLRIWHRRELWCRLQTRLGSGVAVAVAVAVAGSCSSNLTPSLGTSICHGCSPKKGGGEGERRGLTGSLGLVEADLYLQQMGDGVLLYSTGNCIQSLG